MFARLSAARKAVIRLFALFGILFAAACDPVAMGGGGASGPSTPAGQAVKVGLLVPSGSGDSSDNFLAQNLENAARLAISDLGNVQIELRVYSTGGNAAQAAAAATTAVNEGAQILIGPLYADAANAAGIAVANRGVNVLAFTNNASIAGRNVFVLGPTFQNTANRLVSYSVRQGIDRFVIAHSDDLQGNVGRDAIANAVRNNGGSVVGVHGYPLSQQGIIDNANGIANSVRAGGAEAVFMTAGVNADLPILATVLPERGVNPASVRYVGLTRWDAAPQALALPGLQEGLFAMPDNQMTAQFESRYAAAYGSSPHPLAGLAYDGIAAIGALVASGNRNALSAQALTAPQGFQGTSGIFRLLSDGTNQRGLAVATIRNNQVVILDPAPRSFGGGAGF